MASKEQAAIGKLLFPGDPGFDEELAGFNPILVHHPKAVMAAGTPKDVETAVRYAATNRLPIAVQATGHGPSVPADGAVFISTRHMTAIKVDTGARTATMAPGATWAPVIEQAGQAGLAPLVGSSPNVGTTGYLSGGGLPVIGRKYGFSADHVLALDIVTADGKLRQATPSTNADLFYAARGGKGNFGVITSIQVRLARQEKLFGGQLVFPGPAAKDVLGAYLRWVADKPEEMSSSIAMPHNLPAPDGSHIDLAAVIRIAYTGSASDGERLIQPLRALKPILDTVKEIPYSQIGSIHQDPTEPVPSFYKTSLLRTLDAAAFTDKVMGVLGTGANLPPGAVELRHMGGALSRPPRVDNPVGFRDVAKFFFFSGVHLPPNQMDGAKQFHDKLFAAIDQWDSGAAFLNFLGYQDTNAARVKAAYEDADYTRLRRIKAKFDRANLLRVNFNIPPA